MTNPMEAFYTLEKANEGIKIPLHLPTGERSEHWIEIYGVDSDAFRRADLEARREGVKLAAIQDPVAKDEAQADLTRKLRASLIKSWSFDAELTPESASEFLRKAPQIADTIDRVSSNRSLFFGIAYADSKDDSSRTQSTSSSSTRSQKGASKADAKASSKSQEAQGPRPKS